MTTHKTLITGLALLLILALAGCSGGAKKNKSDFAGDWQNSTNDITITNVTEESFHFSFMGVTEYGNNGDLEGEALFTSGYKAVFDFKNEDNNETVRYEFSITEGKLIVSVTEGNESAMIGIFGAGIYMSGEYTKRQSPESNLAEQSSAAVGNDDILAKLLTNSTKFVHLKTIVEHNGQIYAPDNMCIPEWKPLINNCPFAVIGDKVVLESGYGFEFPAADLVLTDLQNSYEKIIADNVSNVIIAGNRVIYNTRNPDFDVTGVFWYDINTSKITKLLDEKDCKEFYSVVSFDDDFVYYKTDFLGDVSRVRWNGTQAEVLQDEKIPKNLYKVENEYYYCEDNDWEKQISTISRYAINSGKPEGVYTITNDGLLEVIDGWAYFGNKTGFHKMNMSTGATVKLADIAAFKEGSKVNRLIGIFGNSIYFTVVLWGEDYGDERLYKVPLNGGTVEYQNLEWGVGGG